MSLLICCWSCQTRRPHVSSARFSRGKAIYLHAEWIWSASGQAQFPETFGVVLEGALIKRKGIQHVLEA